jgi:hypothetical protein
VIEWGIGLPQFFDQKVKHRGYACKINGLAHSEKSFHFFEK